MYAWTPVNPTSNIPADRGRDHPNYWGFSDYWVEDASYVRLRNVTLGYSLPGKLTDRIGFSRFRVYIASQNLITLTGYTGYDPEVGNNGSTTGGLDRGTYPVSRSYRGGIQLFF
ncbi:MAG: hypothetical protein AAF551_02640 [Bacteroidota bacterium]